MCIFPLSVLGGWLWGDLLGELISRENSHPLSASEKQGPAGGVSSAQQAAEQRERESSGLELWWLRTLHVHR